MVTVIFNLAVPVFQKKRDAINRVSDYIFVLKVILIRQFQAQ